MPSLYLTRSLCWSLSSRNAHANSTLHAGKCPINNHQKERQQLYDPVETRVLMCCDRLRIDRKRPILQAAFALQNCVLLKMMVSGRNVVRRGVDDRADHKQEQNNRR